MLALKVNDTFLDIDGASINLEINSPLFSFEITPGDFSYPFNIPPTSKNLIALKHIDVLEIENEIELGTFSAELFLLGNPYLQGELVVLSSNNKSIKVNFNGATSIFYKGIKNKLLTDFDPFNPKTSFSPYASILASYQVCDFVCYEVVNRKFWNDLPAYIGVENFRALYPSGLTQNVGNEVSQEVNGGTYTFTVPMIYVFNYLEHVFNTFGYTLKGDLMSDPEIRTLTFLNNHSLNDEVYTSSGSHSFLASGIPNLPEYVPSVLIPDVIASICKTFCCYLSIDEANKVVGFKKLKNLINSTETISLDEKVGSLETFFDPKNGFHFKHSAYSEISQADFAQNGTVSGMDQFTHYSEDVPNLEFKQDNGEILIDTGVSIPSSVVNIVTFNSIRYRKKSPCISVKGFEKNAYDKNKFKDIVFLFYRGMKVGFQTNNVGVTNFDYALASYDTTDYFGNSTGDYSLLWEGTNGLYEKWWKEWMSFLLKNKEVKTKLLWGVNDILNADLTKKYYFNGSTFFIKKLSIKLTANTINSISAEMLKV